MRRPALWREAMPTTTSETRPTLAKCVFSDNLGIWQRNCIHSYGSGTRGRRGFFGSVIRVAAVYMGTRSQSASTISSFEMTTRSLLCVPFASGTVLLSWLKQVRRHGNRSKTRRSDGRNPGPEALAFLEKLAREFEPTRTRLLAKRVERQENRRRGHAGFPVCWRSRRPTVAEVRRYATAVSRSPDRSSAR